MASINVKLRLSRVDGRMGVIYYQISHRGKTRHITTRIRVLPSEWNGERLSQTAYNGHIIQSCIDSDMSSLRSIISDLNNCGQTYTVKDIIDRYRALRSGVSILSYINSQVAQLKAARRIGTAKNYEKMMINFSEFLAGAYLPISALDEHVVDDYNRFLINRGLVRNSISFYMRVLRAVYNKAVRQQLVVQRYPFLNVYTGVDKTRKRAVSEGFIVRLYGLSLDAGSSLAFARDLFVFSYCMRGMAFVDIAYLRRSNIQNGYISYVRRKTGQLITVKIEPLIEQIIYKYAAGDTPYVFPILSSIDIEASYEQYRIALTAYNRRLRKLSELLGEGCRLTSYTVRHSWATVARNHNIPISVISQSLGHTSERTTQIYLSLIENSVINDANRVMISLLK